MKKIKKNWYLFLIMIFFAGVIILYSVCGTNSYIQVQDNLDLFTAQYQMMKNTGTFFAHGAQAPFLGGVSRDTLPSELSLTSVLYMIMPSFAAYVTAYIFKIIIAIISFMLLAGELLGLCDGTDKLTVTGTDSDLLGNRLQTSDMSDSKSCGTSSKKVVHEFILFEILHSSYAPIIIISGFAYGILNVFPAFGIPFASIPLVIYLFIRTEKTGKWYYYLMLFCYPFISYFSYFGLFICAYALVGLIWVWVAKKKFSLRMFIGLICNALGYVVFEYRLFSMMLFDSTVTIRTTMVPSDLTAAQVLSEIKDVFLHSIFHAADDHTMFILPICTAYFIFLNIRYIVKKNWKGIFHDIYNLAALIIVFDCVIYGLQDCLEFSTLVGKILPPLEGWQFNRTIFFNPFLWYASFFIILKRFYDRSGMKCDDKNNANRQDKAACQNGIDIEDAEDVMEKRNGCLQITANIMAVIAVFVILLTPDKYNDLYRTARNMIVKARGGTVDEMNYREFYATDLYDEIKADIGYNNDWAAAYGFHPAQLEYNGIQTLDGYLGFYPQSYKEEFRKVIAPALDRVEASRIYYDDWGARCYLYGGTDISIVSNSKSFDLTDHDIYIDTDAFRDMGGKYIFSRYELSNAADSGISLVKKYSADDVPYDIWLYSVE